MKLAAIILVAALLFFYRLDEIPNGVHIDEALPGYSAWSLLETGRDEWGKEWPLVLRFYGSFNPPLQTYLTMIPVKILGLSPAAVRAVSAISGILAVVLVYRLAGWKAALGFCLLPVVVLYSRMGVETMLSATLFWWGAYWWWKERWIGGTILLALSTYAAYAERLLVPIFVVGFLILFKGKIGKKWVGIIILLVVLEIPNIWLFPKPAFFPKEEVLYSEDAGGPVGEFLSQYVNYFSPKSLFWLGDADLQRSVPDLSAFYIWMVPFYGLGLYMLWQSKGKDYEKYLGLLLVVGPIAAALTRDPFSTHRAMPVFLPIFLVVWMGIERSLFKAGREWMYWGLVLVSLILLWRSYFVLLPVERGRYWGIGYADMAAYIKSQPQSQFKIDPSRKDPPYAQLLFYLEFPPKDFQSLVDPRIKENYYEDFKTDLNLKFANVEIGGIVWEEDIYRKNLVLVGDEFAISDSQAKEHHLDRVIEVKDLTGKVVFYGYKTNPQAKCREDSKNIRCRSV